MIQVIFQPVIHCIPKQTVKFLVKMKSETAHLQPSQFVGLRSKMYSLLVPGDKPKLTAKGIKKSYMEKKLKHQNYLEVLETGQVTSASFCIFRSRNHVIRTERVRKACLSAFDDKRLC